VIWETRRNRFHVLFFTEKNWHFTISFYRIQKKKKKL